MLGYCISCSLCLLLQMLRNPGVSAFSSGTAHACVDALTVCELPCPDTDGSRRPWAEINNGVLFPCCPEGMDFVAPPVRSQNYLLNSSVKQYQPEEIFTLTLTVEDRDYKYIGLLLYAVKDDSEEKVGEWQLAPEENAKFWKPPLCEGKALMHSSAVSKHYLHTFQYKAPPRGTGSIRFRAIVKHGETNGGSFFWPTVHGGAIDDDLIIGEAPIPPTANSILWTLSDHGGSCDEACEAQGVICDKPAMMFAMQSESAVQFSGPAKFITCRQPILSHNGEASETCNERPLTANEESFCWSRDDGACTYTEENICSAPANDPYIRVCACASNVPATSTFSRTMTSTRAASTTTSMLSTDISTTRPSATTIETSTTSSMTMISTRAASMTTSMLNTDITTAHPPSTTTETTSSLTPALQTSRAEPSLTTTRGISSTTEGIYTVMTSTAMVGSTPELQTGRVSSTTSAFDIGVTNAPLSSTTESETSVTVPASTTGTTTGTHVLQTSRAGISSTSDALHTVLTSAAVISSITTTKGISSTTSVTGTPPSSTTAESATSVPEVASTTAVEATGTTSQALQTSQAGESLTSSTTTALGTAGTSSSSTSTTKLTTTSLGDKATTASMQSMTTGLPAEIVGSMKFSAGILQKRWVESSSKKALAVSLQIDENVVRVFANQSRRLGNKGHLRLLSSVWIVNFIISLPMEQTFAVEAKLSDIQSNPETFNEAMTQQLIEDGADASDAVVTIIDFDAVVQAGPTIPPYTVPDGNVGLVRASGQRSTSSVFLLLATYFLAHRKLSMAGIPVVLALAITLVHS